MKQTRLLDLLEISTSDAGDPASDFPANTLTALHGWL